MILKNIKWLLLLAMLPIFAACSWEELPSYEGADITACRFFYRWASNEYKDDVTGEPLILEMEMTTSFSIDDEAGTANIQVTVPNAQSYFTNEVRSQVSQNSLCCQVTLSPAARIAPADGHKILGIPDDWTEPHKFIVTAADGTKKAWTITVTKFTK
ncbi:MAG: hypothetical protein K2H50_05390 [Paramuribaculum sp.]|nr:hypothetical protein [Barnesiella sp.]MDE5836418.1 hypothetical protein [Paramuribaculum sp.]